MIFWRNRRAWKLKLIILIIVLTIPLVLNCQISDEKLKSKTIKFSNKLIENPDSLIYILQNEKEINSKSFLDYEYLESIIQRYKSIIKAQKRNDFFLSSVEIQPADSYQDKWVILKYKKYDNIFYDFYSMFFGAGCNNTVTYIFSVKEKEIYFKSISICQHEDPSILDE